MLKLIDAFGVPISLKHHDSPSFRSSIGGLTTIFLYGLCLLYGGFIMYQWQTNIILPKYSNYTKTLQSANITLNEKFFAFRFNNVSESVSASKRENCIMLPLLIPMNNSNRSAPIPIFESDQNFTYLQSLPMTVPGNANGAQFYYLTLVPCSNMFQHLGNFTCASDEEIQRFLANPPLTIEIRVNVNQYNPTTQKNEAVSKITFIVFQTESLLYSTVYFQTTNQSVDTGIIFQQSEFQQYISSFSLTNQQVQPAYGQQFLNFKAYAIFLLGLDQMQNQATIVYPKLSEILAMIGSISATILILGQIIIQLNKYLLGHEIEELLIKLLYKDLFKDIKIQYNKFKTIKEVFYKKQPIDSDKFIQQYEIVKSDVRRKLNLIEIIIAINNIQKHLKINQSIQCLDLDDHLSFNFADTPQCQKLYQIKIHSNQEQLSKYIVRPTKDTKDDQDIFDQTPISS